MAENVITAIVTKAADYKDSDKLINLLCSDGQALTCVMKGVKKPKAKLKYGAQVFAFCEYTLTQKGSFNIVTGCTPIEDMFSLSLDADKFCYASLIVEAGFNAALHVSDSDVFLLVMRSLKDILYSSVKSECECATSFLLELIKHLGLFDAAKSYSLPVLIKKFETEFDIKLKSAAYIMNLPKNI